MMPTVLLALMLFLCSVTMFSEATVWNTGYDERLTNAAQWNTIQPNNRAIVYIPVSKYPTKSQESIAKKYIDINYVPRPKQVIVNRPPNSPAIHRPPVQTQLQYLPYTNVNMQAKIPVQQPKKTYSPRPVRSEFETQKVDEYLLHAQMPLPIGQTYVLPNAAHTDELDIFT